MVTKQQLKQFKKTAAVSREDPVVPLSPALKQAGMIAIALVLVLGPLAYLSPESKILYNVLDTPRRLIMLLGAGALATLLLWAWSARRRIYWRRHPLDLPIAIFAGIAILTGLLGLYPRISFFGPLWSQEQALPMLGIGIMLYLGIKEFLRTADDVEAAVCLVMIVGGLVAVIGLLDYFHFLPFALNAEFAKPFKHRLVSTLGNSMFTGTYLAMLIPLGIGAAAAVKSWGRWTVLMCCEFAIIPSLLFTQARAAWLGLVAGLVVVGVVLVVQLCRQQVKVSERLAVTLGVFALAAIIGGGFALSRPDIRARLNSIRNFESETIQTRKVYMRGSLAMFKRSPLVGWGAGNLKMAFPQFRPTSPLTEMSIPLDRGYASALPHNLLLQTAVEMGIFGALALLWIIFTLYQSGIGELDSEEQRSWLALGLLGMLTTYLVTNMSAFDDAATSTMFWIALGLLAALAAREVPFRRALSPSSASLVRAVGLAVAMLTVASVSLQGAASFFTQMGYRHFDALQEMAKLPNLQSRLDEANVEIDGVVKDFGLASLCTPIRDVICEKDLFLAYKAKHDMNPGEEQARDEMLRHGEEALQLADREPMVLRTLAEEYLKASIAAQQAGKNEEADSRLRQAEHLVQDPESGLVVFEPHSSQVRLLDAVLLGRRGKLKDAEDQAKEAIKLDPGYGDAYCRLGRYQHARATMEKSLSPAEAAAELRDAYTNIQHGLSLGYQMTDREEIKEYQDLLQRVRAL